MSGQTARRDENSVPVLLAVSSADGVSIVEVWADPVTHRLLVQGTGGGGSGVSIIDVIGDIDDSNVTFTAASEPSLLVINDGTYQPTGGDFTFTYLAGTITLNKPVGAGGSIFGLAQGGAGGSGITSINGDTTAAQTLTAGTNVTITDNGTGGHTISATGGGGSGTVTSVASADGSVTVTNPTTTPDLTVVKSPKLTTGRTIAVTGDLAYTSPSFDGSGNVTAAGTLATVNSNVGTYGSATKTVTATVNAKGLVTAISEQTATPAVGSVTGLGTGIATALGVNVGTAGAPVVNGGALGTPSSGTATNITGLPVSTGISGLGTGVATFLATPSSANLATAVTDETGSGALVFATSGAQCPLCDTALQLRHF